MLYTDVLTEEDVLGQNRKVITIESRAQNQIPRFYGTPHLAVLNHGHTHAKMYKSWKSPRDRTQAHLQHAAEIQAACVDHQRKKIG
jgi:hypothetical protein